MILGEARMGAEAAALLAGGLWRGSGMPRSDGHPVLLIPGFLAGDGSLGLMTQWLRRLGYRAHGSGITSNVECSQKTVTDLEDRLVALSERYERPVSIIGHSRGGMCARVLGVRHPERVSHVIALGSPLVATLDDIHPVLRLQIRTLQRVQRLGGGGLIASTCEDSWEAYKFGLEPTGCCTSFWEDLDADVPASVGFTSIYSRSDGVLHWRACLDPEAVHVEVESSHCGMAVNPRVYREIAARLLAPAEPRVIPTPAPRVRREVPIVAVS
jgi:pimeloyl-ACP methyl ester carboxylesterase